MKVDVGILLIWKKVFLLRFKFCFGEELMLEFFLVILLFEFLLILKNWFVFLIGLLEFWLNDFEVFLFFGLDWFLFFVRLLFVLFEFLEYFFFIWKNLLVFLLFFFLLFMFFLIWKNLFVFFFYFFRWIFVNLKKFICFFFFI